MIDLLAGAVADLATLIADKIAEETGGSKLVNRKVARAAATAYMAKLRADVTAARERAKARAGKR